MTKQCIKILIKADSDLISASLSYPHFVQNPVKYFSISQEIHRKSQALWEK